MACSLSRGASSCRSKPWRCAIPVTPPAIVTASWDTVRGLFMSIDLTPAQKQQLLQLAWDVIDHGLQTGRVLKPAVDDPVLQRDGASFVTLNLHGELRGCIGSLQAYQPLADDVAQNAFNAAFRDPRFAPLDDSERDALDQIGRASCRERVDAAARAEL